MPPFEVRRLRNSFENAREMMKLGLSPLLPEVESTSSNEAWSNAGSHGGVKCGTGPAKDGLTDPGRELEAILERSVDGTMFCQWKGLPDEENSWELEAKLRNTNLSMVEDFYTERKDSYEARSPSPSSRRSPSSCSSDCNSSDTSTNCDEREIDGSNVNNESMVVYGLEDTIAIGMVLSYDAEKEILEVHRYDCYAKGRRIRDVKKAKFFRSFVDPKDNKSVFTNQPKAHYKANLDHVHVSKVRAHNFQLLSKRNTVPMAIASKSLLFTTLKRKPTNEAGDSSKKSTPRPTTTKKKRD